MVKSTILMLLCFLSSPVRAQNVFDGCPMNGSATTPNLQSLNRLKNRYTVPQASDIDAAVTLQAMLAPGNDRNRWNSTHAAEITGFVLDVKPGGGETCNCGKTDAVHSDTHIELVLHSTDTEMKQTVVVEATPRMRRKMKANGTDWSTKGLRTNIKGKWVTVRGWMTFDTQHVNAAENTHPGAAGNWRATAWEIHPVTDIQMVSAPQ